MSNYVKPHSLVGWEQQCRNQTERIIELEREVAELREALVWMLPQIEASLAAIDVARNDPYVKQSIERCAKYRQLLAQGGLVE